MSFVGVKMMLKTVLRNLSASVREAFYLLL